MPLEAPRLDDLTYERVRDMLIARIPIHAPEWTDHNDSDPGVTMIQLFAWLADQLGYRLNRVPDLNYVQFLKLIGVRLRPAEAAATTLSFLWARPETETATLARAGTRATAEGGDTPIEFETDVDLDVVPAQPVAVLSTRSGDLRQLAVEGESVPTEGSEESWIDERFVVLWNGKQPELQKMPANPVSLAVPSDHQDLWVGVVFNANRSPAAGFLGQRVTLSVQFDDDEQPDPLAHVLCGEAIVRAEALPQVEYAWYRPPRTRGGRGEWEPLRVLVDTTADWSRSGFLRFDVPAEPGPIPDQEWHDVRPPSSPDRSDFGRVGASAPPPVPHPLTTGLLEVTDSTLRGLAVPITGWLRVRFPSGASLNAQALRQLSFNVVPATHAKSVQRERVGRGSGAPGQVVSLAHRNVLADTLRLAVRDPADGLLHDWRRVDELHAFGPQDRVFTFDPEAGVATFGDGFDGLPPAPGQDIVALSYRWVDGPIGDLPPASVTRVSARPNKVTNIVAARGGREAETLEQAKARAPRELRVLGRAVTNSDFRFLTMRTPGLRVAGAEIVALRRPFTDPEAGPGLDFGRRAPGALAVIVVPDEKGPHPTPTEGMLRTVCRWLDRHRLVTTEVHVVSPQYVRLFSWRIEVRPAPGHSRTLLQLAVATHLGRWFHVLTGGPEGKGFPFGGRVHHADLVAQVLAVDGVDRVTALQVAADGRHAGAAASDAPDWRRERAGVVVLTDCPTADGEVQEIQLRGDENVFVDSNDLIVRVAEGT